ncbi:hypothetical protein IGJ28_002625 [Enterococcus sp. AZ091]
MLIFQYTDASKHSGFCDSRLIKKLHEENLPDRSMLLAKANVTNLIERPLSFDCVTGYYRK